MKHKGLFLLLTILLTLFAVSPAAAQEIRKFHVESFGENPFDMSGREKPTSRDDGTGVLYAIIKVTSTDSDDNLKAYRFNFGYLKDVREMHDGILWVYVQNGAKTVDIMRDGFHTIRRYNLETTLQPGKVYDLVLKPEPKVISMQNLLFVVEPANSKAMIMYTDESGEEKLFGQVDEEGCAFKKLVLGKYFYKIISESYHTSEGVVTLSTPSGKHTETVTLRPNFSNITLTVENGADIYINDEKRGTGQWSGNLSHGTYSIECRKANHKSTLETITVEDGKNTTYTLKAPTPIVGSLSISSTPLRAQISIGGKAVGETPEMIDGLTIGNHKVTISKDGYETATVDIAIKENETTEHNVELKKIESPAPVVSKNNAKNGSNGNTAISGNIFTVNGVTFTMIPVKGGTFKMGATSEQQDSDSDEKPVHSVTLSDYYIGETEVTQALWQAVMGSNPSHFKGKNKPVEMVSYDDCKAFINKLNTLLANQLPAGRKFRLPTEAEWEYAARGGNQSNGYRHSGSNTLGDVAWYCDNSRSKTHPVKQKQPNELGIYDMSGNVWEWCSDWYGIYPSSAQTNPTGPSLGSDRVLRGNCFSNFEQNFRVALRHCNIPGNRKGTCGLRLALDGATAAVGVSEQHNVLSARSKAMSAPKTSAPYKIGDYYNDGTKEGIVFEISNGGYNGKIVSLEYNICRWSLKEVETDATSKTDGMYNMQKICSLPNWQNDYPAFAWCASLGEGWYLPAFEELKAIYAQYKAISNALNVKENSELENNKHLSSTQEYSSAAWYVRMGDGYTGGNFKTNYNYVRAVSAFGAEGSAAPINNNSPANLGSITSAPYKIGNYYNDGKKEGVVFEISNGGYSGKIVSLEKNYDSWSEGEDNIKTGATSKTDGMYNMQKIRSLNNWQKNYPPFAWCASLGDEWYLPAIDELWSIYTQRDVIDKTLMAQGKSELDKRESWSSTEKDGLCAWGILIGGNGTNYEGKSHHNSMRAISTFGVKSSIPHTQDSGSTLKRGSKTSAPYKVGDYYNDGKKEGVVFEISNGGYSGKIVSLEQTKCGWSKHFVNGDFVKTNATSKTDGMANMSAIFAFPNWKTGYPAFAWCASLGEGWYLPAIKELKVLCLKSYEINKTLKKIEQEALGVMLWSSTQYNIGCAWHFDTYSEKAYNVLEKWEEFNVRAVAAF